MASTRPGSEAQSVLIFGPDLRISDLSVAPHPSNLGTDLTARVRGYNAGTIDTTTAFQIDLWEHRTSGPTDLTGSNADWTVSGLAKSRYTDFFEHQFTPSTSGTFRAWAWIDSTEVVTEDDETNNTGSCSYTVDPMPDLVSSLELSPDAAGLGQDVEALVTASNEGTADSGPFYLSLWEHLDEEPTDASLNDEWWSFEELTAGASTTTNTYLFTPSATGSYRAWALADSRRNVAEAYENNNASGADYTVKAPDLVVSSLSVTPDSLALGETVVASVTGTNQGDASAGSFLLSLWEHLTREPVDGSGASAFWSFTDLRGGASTDRKTHSFQPSGAGSFTAWAFIDSGSQVTESEETNNTGSYTYTVNAPDLIVTSLTVAPEPSELGTELTATFKAKNQGDLAAEAFRIDLWEHLGSPPAGTGGDAFWAVTNLDPQEETSPRTYTFTPGALGSYTAWVLADSADDLVESDETNNAASDEYTVCAPDLAISELSVTPDPSALGKELTATIKVRNEGNSSVDYVWLDFWEHLDEPPEGGGGDGSWLLGRLDPAEEASRTYAFTPAAVGGYTAWASVHALFAQDANEDNNISSFGYLVQGPDLAISHLSVAPAVSTLGAELTATVKGHNQGSGVAGPCWIDFWEHAGAAPTDDTGSNRAWPVVALHPRNGTGQLTYSFTPSAVGSYTAWALIDSRGEVEESDETNNAASCPYAVGLAELVVSQISIAPDPSDLGAELTATVKGYNYGPEPAGHCWLDFWEHADLAPTDDTGSNHAWEVEGLDPQTETEELTYNFTPSAVGNYTAWALIDSQAEVDEWDETNNAANDEYLVEYHFQPDARVRGATDTTWIGDDYYGRAGRQTKAQGVNAGGTGVFHISIQNDGETDDSFVVTGRAGTTIWPVKYYDAFSGGSDITAQVSGPGGWTVGPLASGAAVPMRCEMTAPADAIGNSRRSRIVRATSVGDGANWDAVKAVIRVRVKRQPDGWIRLPGEPWKGDNIYNGTGAGQNYTQRIRATGKAVYHIYWQNDGNVVDILKVRGPGDDGYWKVRYYDAFRGGMDITDQVTGTGWETAPTAPGGKRSMRVEVSVDSGAPSDIARTIRIRGLSATDTTKRDVVKAKTVVR